MARNTFLKYNNNASFYQANEHRPSGLKLTASVIAKGYLKKAKE